MFTSLKRFIESRLESGIVVDDFSNNHGFFIKCEPAHLYRTAFFLKNDPDVRLLLLDQILALPSGFLPWTGPKKEQACHEILYQLESIKLPYRVTIVIEEDPNTVIESISSLYPGARFFEIDLRAQGIAIEESGDRES